MFVRGPFFTFRPTTSTATFQISDPAFVYDAWSFSADGILKFKGSANNAHAATGDWRVKSAFSMVARNNANSADVNLISKNSSDVTAIGGTAGMSTSGDAAIGGKVTTNKVEKGGTLLTADATCAAGDYWIAPIAGAVNKWRACDNGTVSNLVTAASTIRRQCTYIMDNGASVLADTDDTNSVCANRYGSTFTVVEVWCKSDTGTPTIMARKNGTTNILSGNLTCSSSGASTTSFASSTYANGDTIDYLTQTAGGAAHRVLMVVSYQ
jgi:hypothetical protein